MSLAVDVDLPGRLVARAEVSPGETLAVVGPNGAGKSTLLAAVAGTLPDRGARVGLDDHTWTDRPPQRRSVGMLFQDHQLFDHLSVLDNVAFGPRARGLGRRSARERARTWLERLGVADLADRAPRELSGGQAQRVALARALATEPRVLLLDEPFAALDVSVAARLRAELADHLTDFTGCTLLVTHDAVDVHSLADRVLVLEDGRGRQVGAPHQVAEAPATAHAARLLGLNVLAGTADGDRVALASGGELVTATPVRGPVLATFPPYAVTVTVQEPSGSARNRWPATVRRLSPPAEGDTGVVRVHLDGARDLFCDLTRSSVDQLGLSPGTAVWASVKATEVTVLATAASSSGAGGRDHAGG